MQIQFDIDISEPIFHRKELDWNSKKVGKSVHPGGHIRHLNKRLSLDDDQIETTISVLYHPSYVSESPATPPDSSMMVDVESKNHESDSGFACCLQSNGVINCSRCLEMGFNYIVRELGNEKQIYLEMRQKIDAAGVDGLSGETVFVRILLFLHSDLFHDLTRTNCFRRMSNTCGFCTRYYPPILPYVIGQATISQF